jgi:hypothetical protein
LIPKPKPRTPAPGDTLLQVQLVPQTGMPSTYFQRSREVSMTYDALQAEAKFKFNKFGPQQLNLCRPETHW